MMDKNINRVIVLHVLAILAYLSLPVISSPDLNLGLGIFKITPFLQLFFRQILLLIFFYCNYYYFLPEVFCRKLKFVYAGIILFCGIIVVLLPELVFPLKEIFHHIAPHNISSHRVTLFFKPSSEGGVIQYVFILIFSYLLNLNQSKNQIEREKQEIEISFLKAQINPHFLFNSLNTIYALALKKNDKTPDAILQLASLMRFIMSESPKETIEVNQEIKFIRSYVLLQKSRFGFTSLVEYDIKECSTEKKIIPLILIPFVENAFQYGINPNEKSSVFIKIEVVDATLHFVAKNTIVARSVEGNKIGLQNTIRRLNLIYPNQHTLELHNSGTHFTVNLNIQLI